MRAPWAWRARGSDAVALAVAAALALCAAAPAAATPGGPDPAFGSGGIAPAAFGATATAAGVARAPDGRLVIAGDEAGDGVLVARFTPAGALDGSFAGGGLRRDRFGEGGQPPQRGGAVAVQADGAIVVAGIAGDTWLLARYRPDGSPDVLFGAGGVALRDPSDGGGFPPGSGPQAITIAADGRILVAGSSGVATDDGARSERIVVARYSDRGVPDPAFGRNGFATLQLGAGSPHRHAQSAAAALAALADGRIVIAGRASDSHGSDRALLARLTSSGGLDTSFAAGGRLLAQLGSGSAARSPSSALAALGMRADGTLLAAGRASDVAGGDAVALAHVTAGGAPAAGFGHAGVVVTQLGALARRVQPRSLARALVVAPDGGVLVAGAATGGTLAARFDPADGRLSCAFGTGGRTLLPGAGGFDPATDGAASAVAQPDGALVLAGRRARGGVLLARLLPAVATGAPVAGTPRVQSLGLRAAGGGRGYAYGYVDGACASLRVRFAVTQPSGRLVRTRAQVVRAGFGPQVVCARLRGVRAGRRYAILMLGRGPDGSLRERRVLRLTAHATTFAQEGCVR